MQQCIHCKADLPADAQFCDRCGTSVEEEQHQFAESTSTTTDDAADMEDTSKRQAVSSSSPELRTIRTRRMHSQQSIPDFPQGGMFPLELPEEPALENVENLDFAPPAEPGEQNGSGATSCALEPSEPNIPSEQEAAPADSEYETSEPSEDQAASSPAPDAAETPTIQIEDLPTQIVPATPAKALETPIEIPATTAQPAETPAAAETLEETPATPAQSAETPAAAPTETEEATVILARPAEASTTAEPQEEATAVPVQSIESTAPEKPAEPPPLLGAWPGETTAIPATPTPESAQPEAAADASTVKASPTTPATLDLPEPQPVRRKGRGKLVAIIVIVVLVVLAGGAGAFALINQRTPTGTAAQCTGQQTGCANSSPTSGHAGASHLVFANAVSGPLAVNGQSHCQVVTLANQRALTVTLSGTVNGKFYNFGFTIARYQGAKTYDSAAGSLTVLLDVPGESTTNGWGNTVPADAGTVTVARGEQAGSISFLLSGFGAQAGTQVQVSGDWACG